MCIRDRLKEGTAPLHNFRLIPAIGIGFSDNQCQSPLLLCHISINFSLPQRPKLFRNSSISISPLVSSKNNFYRNLSLQILI